jgi:hypothetical protein
MNKPIEFEYIELLPFIIEELDAGWDMATARENAKLALLRLRNAEAQYDHDHENRGR